MSLFVSAKEKKKRQLKKNKYHQMIYEMVRLRRYEAAQLKDADERQSTRKRNIEELEDKSEALWSSKVHEVRNRLNNKKRVSKERWNRFAGTDGDEGARGL